MKRNFLILMLVFLVGVGGLPNAAIAAQSSSRQDSEATAMFREGVAFYDDGRLSEAERKFRETLSKYPKAAQSDRTSYYLIVTLVKLRRYQDAQKEIADFRKNYPGSAWRRDVDEESLELGSRNGPLSPEEKAARQRDLSAATAYTGLPDDANLEAVALRRLLELDPERGIETARERLKHDPSDTAVYANLGTIYMSSSPQALPLLLTIAASTEASPKVRNTAFFWASRRNPDKLQVAQTLMDMLAAGPDNEPIVSEALFRMTIDEHRVVLDHIVASSRADKMAAIEKIYNGGSITLRSDLLMSVARLPDTPATNFIMNAAKNDPDLLVRQAALRALSNRKNTSEREFLENILRPPVQKSSADPR